MNKWLYFALFWAVWLNSIDAQSTLQQTLRASHQHRHHELLSEYVQFCALPNTWNDPEQLRQNAAFIVDMMKKRGITNARTLEVNVPGAIPAVYGEVMVPGATRTLVFYAHYDGQPVNPSKWAEGLSPFKPQLATASLDKGGTFLDFPAPNGVIQDDWRLYGRATADDKAGVFTILNAYDALRRSGLSPQINLKFFFEGEEERGSTNLEALLSAHQALLKADAWVIVDGPMPASGRKQVTFGVRGDVNMNLTVFGAKRPLHSGNYGNWAPNPALKLVHLLASMKNKRGKVLIKGFYDDVVPLSKSEQKALAAIPDPAPIMQQELAFAAPENPKRSYLESISTLPTLNINGIESANVGKLAANIIPTTATVTLDLRLVKGNEVKKQIQKVIDHVKTQGYLVLDREPTDAERMQYPDIAVIRHGEGYNAQRTSMDLPVSQAIIQAIRTVSPSEPVLMPSAGGSLPLFLFEKVLNAPPITIPVVNYDNNQHGENENLRIGCLWEGIETIGAVMLLRW